MSKKQNPYHLWLGLPAEVVSPNFFQLLGIATNATDDQQIAATARANAQKLLDRLKKVPVKSESEKAIREKLKTRIVTAHKTISAPVKRKQYAQGLAQKQSSSTGSKMPSSAPPKVAPTPTPPTATAAAASAAPTPPTPPSNAPTEIPQAIPLAMPLNAPAQPAQAEPASDDPFAGISDQETIRVRPVRARGKRSSIIPIVITLLVITVIGGLVSFLTNYKNVFEVLAERNQTTATSTQNVASTTTPNSVDPEEAPPEPLQVPEKFQSLVGSQPKTGSNNKATIEGSTAKDSTDKGSTARTSEDGMTGSGSKKKDANALSENTDGEKMEPKDPPQANKSELSPAEKAASASVARVAVDMVRAALMRRDIPAARTANQRIKRLSGAEFLDAQTMSLLEYQRTQNEQMIAHVEVFLTQLQSAAVEMPGGQDVEVGKLVMSLVDGGPTEVTLRRAGRNDVVPYTDLPTSVAIALGDLGSKKSVPKWNMAKAAVLTIQSQHTPALNEKAKPFLRQSIADGYDVECQTISDYQNIAWQKKHLPAKLSADPTAEQADDLLREFRAANGYKNPKRVKSDGAPNVIEELLFSPAPTPKERKARLSDAITVAAAQKDFDAVLVATGELYRMSKPVNIKDTVVSPISHLMRDDMSAAETRHLVHTIIGLTKQLKGRKRFEEQAKDKLLGHAQTLVEEFDYSELAPKIKQLMKQ